MAQRTVKMRGNPLPVAGPELRVGDTAPDFKLHQRGPDGLRDVTRGDFGGKTLILSVVPSLDTPVCEMQTKKFNEAAAKLPAGVAVLTVSMDLPFAQKRFCGNFGLKNVSMLSDHRSGSFGENYGTLIPDLRIHSRAIFVVDGDQTLQHVEYVRQVGDHPDYEAALKAAREALHKA